MKQIHSTAPGSGYEALGVVRASTEEEIKAAVSRAKDARLAWQSLSLDKRKSYIATAFRLFQERADEFVELVMKEVGKTKGAALSEFDRAFDKIAWFLENVDQAIQAETTYEDDSSLHRIVYEAYGTAAVIAPWNFPFGMFVWGVFPNLLVGNTVVFKTSEECPLSGVFIDTIMKEVGFPPGVFSQIFGDAEEGRILFDQDVDLIWFTGSTKSGQEIFAKAGAQFVKAILELGGSNPALLFEDVDVASCVEKIFLKRFSNCGQTCDALKRLLVHDSLEPEAIAQLVEYIGAQKFGSNMEDDTVIGPLVAERQCNLIEEQIADAVAKGAEIHVGGKRASHLDGAYFHPTLISKLNPSMKIWTEEVFGPVLLVIPFSSEEEAIEIANATEYGLGAIVFSKDIERGRRVASRIEAGTVEINSAVHWLNCNPFGGYKKSGMGREHGILGFKEVCQIKVISEEKPSN